MKKYTIQLQSRTVRDCFKIATSSQEFANRTSDNWEKEHHIVTGITFTAFTIEAMLNHYGMIYFPDWNNTNSRRKESHSKLFKAVNLPNYLGCETYKTAKTCFFIRDTLAHGKTTEETVEIELSNDLTQDEKVFNIIGLNSKPFQRISLDTLNKFIDTTKQMEKDIENNGFYPNKNVNSINHKTKLSESPLSTVGPRSW